MVVTYEEFKQRVRRDADLISPRAVVKRDIERGMQLEGIALALAKKRMHIFAEYYLSEDPPVNQLYDAVAEFSIRIIRLAVRTMNELVAEALGYTEDQTERLMSAVVTELQHEFESTDPSEAGDILTAMFFKEAGITQSDIETMAGGGGPIASYIKSIHRHDPNWGQHGKNT
jgi:aspartokinase